ncbi:MAG: DEAD/DEAH box helicase family protein [Acidobacteria bacterium]|nr:DEAD/DEAH box helicase family protein [Acidobacteriota bacterium]
MRIDFENRTLRCAVGDLSWEESYRKIGGDRSETFRRMWIGREIHEKRAGARAAADPNYRPEVFVTHKASIRGWEVTVAGRIDGLSVDASASRAVVEEVKSIHFELELERLMRSERLQHYLYQLHLYAWFLSRREEYASHAFAPQLVLIDLVSGEAKTIESPFDAHAVEETFRNSLEALVGRLESERALRMAKSAWAESIEFPHDRMRPFQVEMIAAVERAVREGETLLVSAPTGIGKTIAAIFPALRECLRRGKKLFFLTPKTLQQDHAVRAFEALNDGTFRVLRVRAKKRMCANDEVICHEDFCPYARDYAEKMERNHLVSRIRDELSYFDPDVVFEMARSEKVCPFEVSLELVDEADVIVCDYNYVFDPYVGLKAWAEDGDWSDCVFIVDEAHNLLDRGRGYYSPDIGEEKLRNVTMHLASRPYAAPDGWDELVDELRTHLHDLAEPVGSDPGSPRQALCEPDIRLLMRQRLEWEKIVLRYIAWKIENRVAEEDDPVIDFYYALVRLTDALANRGGEFSHIIERRADELVLKVFCKDPSRFLGEIIGASAATIAMSATLEPFDFHRRTLGFPTDRTAELSLPSPFPRENRRVLVVADVDTTWKARAGSYDPIAKHVATIASATKGNALALFPSYAFLQEVSYRLPATEHEVFVQRPDMTEYERRAILDALTRTKVRPCLILAVAGGMYAEGIDYQGDMLSAVCVVGPALPSLTFEQELLKNYYDEQYAQGFEFAYLIPGMTRVVQSAGRVIRSERDVGVIALLCRRFTQPQYTRYFPSDWYESSPRELTTRDAAGEIRRFFDLHSSPQLRLL